LSEAGKNNKAYGRHPSFQKTFLEEKKAGQQAG